MHSYHSFNNICKFQVILRLNTQIKYLDLNLFFFTVARPLLCLVGLYLPESGRVTLDIMPGESSSSLCAFLCNLLFLHFFSNCFLKHGKIGNNYTGKKPLSFFKRTKAIFPIERKVVAIQKLNGKFHLFQADLTLFSNFL